METTIEGFRVQGIVYIGDNGKENGNYYKCANFLEQHGSAMQIKTARKTTVSLLG